MPTSTVVASGSRAVFAHRDFRLFQMARLLTIVGMEMQSVASPLCRQVYEIIKRQA
ncbi:MAG TPA: hypothetical protein VN622_01385 [Clostridia bacterium]|nr:hypothetical protein [Clostridia bacterium]